MDIDFKKILLDYEKLIRTKVMIPLNTNDVIKFEFKPNNLPHLLGLHYLVDINILFEYKNKRVKAMEIYLGIKNDLIDTEEFKKSKYYAEIYKNRLIHFSSERIINLLKNADIFKFDPAKVKNFDTKLDKVDYLLFEIISCDNKDYTHFGIGFSNDDDDNYANTFFARDNNDYIVDQDQVYPNSLYIKDRNKNIFFKIYWHNVRTSLKRNSHYKALLKLQSKYNFDINTLTKDNLQFVDDISNIDDRNEIQKHFRLLRLDEVKEAYKPYIDNKLWNNSQKQYLIELIDNNSKDYLPNEIKQLLNNFKC